MNRHALFAFALPALLSLPAPALAQAGRDRAELAQDRHEIRQDRRALVDDWRDSARMDQRLAPFGPARARRDRGALGALDREVALALRQEVAEPRRELARAHAEVR